jgi:hypothetical protein
MPVSQDGYYYESDGTLHLPTLVFDHRADKSTKQDMANYLDTFLTQLGKINLIQAAKKNIDLNVALSAHKVIAGTNATIVDKYPNVTKPQDNSSLSSAVLISLGLAKESLQNGGERYKGIAKEVIEDIEALNTKNDALMKAMQKPKARYSFDKIAGAEYNKVQKSLNTAIKVDMLDKNSQLGKMAQHPKYAREAFRAKVVLKDLPETKLFVRIMNNGDIIGKQFFRLGILLGAVDITKSIIDGDDWGKETAGFGGAIAGSFLGARVGGLVAASVMEAGIIALGFTPAGWVVLIGSAAITGALALGVGSALEEGAEDLYSWVKLYVMKWY